MSTSTSAFGVAAHNRHSSRKATSRTFFGSAAVACLVVGCGWSVYANVFGASVYPTLGNADYDLPVVKRPLVAKAVTPEINVSQIAERRPPRISAPAVVAAGPSLSFAERFAAASPQGDAPTQIAEASPPAAAPKLAEAPRPKPVSPQPAPVQVAMSAPPPPPRAVEKVETRAKAAVASVRDMTQRAKAAVMSIASNEKQSIYEKLWGKPQASQPHGSLLSYASADASVTGSLGAGSLGAGSLGAGSAASQNSATLGSVPRYERDTAVYDISAHTVYLPDGSKLEAHSGLGSKLDDPRFVNVRMSGATPPHLYDLTPRESLFHGVAALRLNPVGGEDEIFGRSGLLAHTFMLGPNGDSNGCVSFRDYNAFLNAYRNQGIKRLAVVAKVE